MAPSTRDVRSRKAQAAGTREQLLQAAHQVFAERGYQATTIGAITAAADTAHGTFYLYFKNKEDVFIQLVENLSTEIVDRVFAPLHLDGDGISEALRGFLEVFVSHGSLWRCYLEGALLSPAVFEKWKEVRAGFTELVLGVLEQHEKVDIGAFDRDILANAVASLIEWTVTTQFVLGLPPASHASIEDTARDLGEMLRRILLPEPHHP